MVQVELSGHSVEVTSNLHAALQRLRDPNKRRTIWIDQLCINQWDLKEKSSQVAMMREIYKGCTRCLIWLGEIPNANKTYAFKHAEAVFTFIKTVAAVERRPLKELPDLFEDTDDGRLTRFAFEDFAMYGNSWWSRIWTVQEAIIPSSALLLWGPLCVNRGEIMAASQMLRSGRMHLYFSPEFMRCRTQHYKLLRHLLYPVRGFLHSSNNDDGPLDILMRWRHRSATDPRDKVYALMGLIPNSALPSAQICDYEIDAGSLFSNVTADLIRLEGGLRPFLGSCEMPHTILRLPTWAIDFSTTNRVGKHQLKWWNHTHRYRQFRAAGKRILRVSHMENSNVVKLAGCVVDEVIDVMETLTVDADETISNHKLHDAIMQCRELASQYYKAQLLGDEYVAGGSWASAFWRTMLGDLLMSETPIGRAKAHHAQAFEEIVQRLKENMECSGPVYESLCGMVPNHSYFVTKRGYMGIGPPQIASGDEVWILYGGRVPFILRKAGPSLALSSGNFTLVGDAYVHGVMDGEAVLVSSNTAVRTIRLH
ncbi:hypothetical protein NX059_000055 [Plenodomus lindquistii]|nr:hypothetical protein NX059_000055 [Plenodomus lindquistii]